MSQGRNRNQNRNQGSGKKQPWGDVFHVEQLSEDKSKWVKLGVAWRHEDGKGFDFTLDAEPIAWKDPKCERRVVIRKRDQDGGE